MQLMIVRHNPTRNRAYKAAAMFAEIAAWRRELAEEERIERERRAAVVRAHTVYKGGADNITDDVEFRRKVRAERA